MSAQIKLSKTENFIKKVPLISLVFALLCIFTFALSFIISSHVTFVILAQLFLILSVGVFLFKQNFIHKKIINEIELAASPLEEMHSKLTHFNNHLHALHNFTNKLTIENDVKRLCTFVTETVVTHFNYDASQLWVYESSIDDLNCESVSGYQSEEYQPCKIEYLGAVKKLMLQTLRSGATRMFDSSDSALVDDETKNVSNVLKISSCIITPLMNGDVPIGVLTAEFHDGKTMGERDRRFVESISSAAVGAIAKGRLKYIDSHDSLLLSSISHIVGDALVKIELFNDMERRIEERTRELRIMQEELRDAREMVIQSEKLSSLGRMAAGVIHQINDPLNFLVNILPELRKDFDALLKIREIIKESSKNPDQKKLLADIDKEYDLDQHIEELDYVFNRAANSLVKSMKIAKGLSVFTSDNSKDEILSENLLDIALRVIDLIPGKMKGQTEVVVVPNTAAVWNVNASQMEQVFMNIITNAIDAMDRQGKITITGSNIGKDTTVHIVDDGPGIPEHLLGRIFDPFFTTKPAGKSTGLGLSISAEIVKKFGGYLKAANEPSGGAHFIMSFTTQVKTN